MWNGQYYAMTLVTTIGYGNMATVTGGGRCPPPPPLLSKSPHSASGG